MDREGKRDKGRQETPAELTVTRHGSFCTVVMSPHARRAEALEVDSVATGAATVCRCAPALPRLLGWRHVSSASAGILALLGTFLEHFVDQTEFLGLVGFEKLVAVHGLLDLLDRLTGILGVE